MSSLFLLTGQYLQLAHKLADADFDADTIADTIDASGIVDNITDKIQAIEYVARGAEAHNAAIDTEITRLQALKAHRAKTAQGLRDYIKRSMDTLEIERIVCPMFEVSIRKNPPKVEIYDTLSIPALYMMQLETPPPTPNKKLIGSMLKEGQEVPGAKITQSTRLHIA